MISISSFSRKAQQEDPFSRTMILKKTDELKGSGYLVEDGLLYKTWGKEVITKKLYYIPSSIVEQLLNSYHTTHWAGHFGFRRTYGKLIERYWWPKMKMDIREYIHQCSKCQQFNIDRRKPPGFLHPIEPPLGPFQLIGIDYTGPFPITSSGNKYVLAITDYFTKWVVAIPLSNQTAQTTADALYQYWICQFGVPKRILSDQGTHFCNYLMAAITHILGCHHLKSTPYHPQTNGVIERFNSTFERQLAKLTSAYENEWDIHVHSVVFAYNTGIHATTGFSPFELLFGRKPMLPADLTRPEYILPKPHDYFNHFKKTLRIYHRNAKDNIVKNQEIYKKRFDQQRANPVHTVGDYVLKKLSRLSTKLSPLYSEPFIIVRENHPTYWIQDPEDQHISQVHVSQLRHCRFM